GIGVRFGGLVALDGVTLRARGGTITGLIGPNGAGKTTFFNACAGVVPTSAGTVSLGGEELRGAPSARAQRGLGRTFQKIELFDDMTVSENVAMGPECLYAGRRPWRQLAGSAAERRDVEARTHQAMEQCRVEHLGARIAGELSTGQRRLIELARAVACPFTF